MRRSAVAGGDDATELVPNQQPRRGKTRFRNSHTKTPADPHKHFAATPNTSKTKQPTSKNTSTHLANALLPKHERPRVINEAPQTAVDGSNTLTSKLNGLPEARSKYLKGRSTSGGETILPSRSGNIAATPG
ncbi:hypothetical protein [Mycobacterium sp.]|uniref:hypothetical protein n=1 Tax=Mycobacterium sp. TaxID=1785 RepID=UPI003BAD4CE4